MLQETLARRMFLILHDSFSGKPGVEHKRVKGGVVAASLAELMMQHRLAVQDDRVVVLDPQARGLDEIAAFLVQSIQHQRRSLDVPTWVDSVGDVMYELVARWLVSDGVVRREHGSRRLVRRGPDNFPAADLLRAAGPRVRLEHMLRHPGDFDQEGAVLAGIIWAIDAAKMLDADGDRAAIASSISATAQQLPEDLMNLMNGLQSAVALASYKMRRF